MAVLGSLRAMWAVLMSLSSELQLISPPSRGDLKVLIVRVNFVIVIANLFPSHLVSPEPAAAFLTVAPLLVVFLVHLDPASTGDRV